MLAIAGLHSTKKAEDEATKKKGEDETAEKTAEDDAAKDKAEEEATKKNAGEEAAKKKAEDEAVDKKAAEESAIIVKALEAAVEADRKKAGHTIPYTLTRMIGTRDPEKRQERGVVGKCKERAMRLLGGPR